LVAIIIAVAYGVAYWAGLARGFRPKTIGDWAARLRDANLHLAAATCLAALILALPLFDFGAISARNQIARLEAGRVSVEEFDFAALRWEFGDAGRRALTRLAEGEGEGAEPARLALAETERTYSWQREQARGGFTGELRVQPENAALQERVETFLDAEPWRCNEFCVALDLGAQASGFHRIALVQSYGYETFDLPPVGEEGVTAPAVPAATAAAPDGSTGRLNAYSVVELREEVTRSIFIDGRRVGVPVEIQTGSEPVILGPVPE
jgi:hypothetical protein